jgi:plasmid stabilization system protein ParE
MTRRVTFAPEAEAQLASLFRYIAREASPDIALRYTDAIVTQCEALADFSERGTPRDDLRPGLRTIAFRRRVIIAYAVDRDEVAILGIFYGGQDVQAILRED